MMTKQIPKPSAVFDTLKHVIEQHKTIYNSSTPRDIIATWLRQCFAETDRVPPDYAERDYQIILNFLYSYRGSQDTFTAYRRELERLLQWSWFVADQSLLCHKRPDIEAFVEFCIKPPPTWIGLKTVARFKSLNGLRCPNPEWHPFDVHISKKDHKAGGLPEKNNYQFSQQALKVMFAVLGSFYSYLLQEEITSSNPVALIRQKSKFIRKQATQTSIRRLSDKQWQTVITVAKQKVADDEKHERGVFILSCLYGMYLRISELVASGHWSPTMGDFFKDSQGHWWFKTIGKGNKERQIAVSEAMLKALIHYRTQFLHLSPYPAIDEKTPLVSHLNNPHQPITSERPIRHLVQFYFDAAADQLEQLGAQEDADSLRGATVHWLRHTGISDDVKQRPREHVRDDAGHSSGAITDRYIDVELTARARSARKKQIVSEQDD